MILVLISFSVITYITALETPIIGVLSQEAYLVRNAYPDAHSFIAASYVKLLESSGARVLPIWIGQDNAYYARVVNYTNGILFPGGGTYFNETGGYGEAAKQIYNLAITLNENKVHYPLWGICLGLQVLMFAAAGDDIRKDCSAKDVSLPLEFVEGYENSRIYSGVPSQLLDDLKTKNLTYNNHRYCIMEEDLRKNNLLSNWNVLSKNHDSNGIEFVSTLEHKTYPFYGTQYHPERNSFEFKKTSKISHDFDAIELAQSLTNFFVKEARKNTHSFPDSELETESLIYNYNPVYSITNTSWEQLYLFKPEQYERNLL